MSQAVGWFSRDAVPARLREHAEALSVGSRAASAEGLVAAAVDATRRVIEHQGADRTTALDLLAIDALVTRAIEDMASDPTRFEARSLEVLRTLSSIATSP
ncbi:MAG: hypothetical protein IT361_16650 [Gemmatimonadaceae bacterium]|nr:hypothetical protein [Gemmatimonadaceae bacterium]